MQPNINGEQLINIENVSKEPYFDHKGCDNCGSGLGVDVYNCKAYTIPEGKTEVDFSDYYEIKLCAACLYCWHYSEPSDDMTCKNVYFIATTEEE